MKSSAIAASLALALIAIAPGVNASTGPQEGIASFYGNNDGFHGGKTANGKRYDKNSMTAAHKTAKFGTKMKVTNLSNGKSVVVRINNRGPYIKGRIIDVSVAAARQLGFFSRGVTKVRIEPVGAGTAETPPVAPAPSAVAAVAPVAPIAKPPTRTVPVAASGPLDLAHFVAPARPIVAAAAVPVKMPLPQPRPAR